MRHRITSFRCVVGPCRMRESEDRFKPCNDRQLRQSSTARAGSGAERRTSGMTPAASTHNRPRLKASASSKGSLASSMLPGGSCRSLLVVATRIGCAGAAPVREKLTRRVARVQRITKLDPARIGKHRFAGRGRRSPGPHSGGGRTRAPVGGRRPKRGRWRRRGGGLKRGKREGEQAHLAQLPSLSTLARSASSSAFSAATSSLGWAGSAPARAPRLR